MYNTFVGIDISKDSFDVCIIGSEKKKPVRLKLEMASNDFSILSSTLSEYKKNDILVAMESTGSYHYTLFSFLIENDYNVSIVNPYLINNFIKSETLRKSKTDEKDAQHIANFTLRFNDRLRIIKDDTINTLKPIIRERENLAQSMASLKTEIKGLLNFLFPELLKEVNVFTRSNLEVLKVFPSAKSVLRVKENRIRKILNKASTNQSRVNTYTLIELATDSIGINARHHETVLISKVERLIYLQKEIKKFEEILDDEINNNNNDDFKILTSVSGIGDITAQSFLIEIKDINNFNSAKQIIAFFGTDPAVKHSGSSINVQGKISKRGNPHGRRTIWLMAVGVIRNDPYFNIYFRKKRNEGMKYKKAVIATANKLIRVLFGMLKSRTEYILKLN